MDKKDIRNELRNIEREIKELENNPSIRKEIVRLAYLKGKEHGIQLCLEHLKTENQHTLDNIASKPSSKDRKRDT